MPNHPWHTKLHSHWTVSEDEGHRMISRTTEEVTRYYSNRRNTPSIDGTSRLSPFLAWGNVSPRQVCHAVLHADGHSGTRGENKFLTEIGWREFSYHLLYHFPHMETSNLQIKFDKFDWEKSKVLPALMRRAIERQDPFEVWGDGNDLKDFLYIDDFIEALLACLTNLKSSEPINIASGIPITIKEALNEILIAANYQEANIQFDASKPSMIPKRLINIELAETILGFKPKVSFSEGIKNTIDWYKDFYSEFSPEDKK